MEQIGISKRIETWESFRSEHGKSQDKITCPFCNEVLRVYAWSYAGCGKKCNCGALLQGRTATKLRETNN